MSSPPSNELNPLKQLAELQEILNKHKRRLPVTQIPPQTPKPNLQSLPPEPTISTPKSPQLDNLPSLFEKPELVKPSGTPLDFPSPLHMLMAIAPEMAPHPWQEQELLRLGGYLDPSDIETKYYPNPETPLLYVLSAANGSGKDQYIVAAFCLWFVLVGYKNRAIMTSSSREQLKTQTEPGILYLISRLKEAGYGDIFRSVEFHHVCLLTGGEVKFFATDEPKRVEGYHPWHGGQMALLLGESKSIDEEIALAFKRCTGYSYWLHVSSPASKSGHMYRDSQSGVEHPNECRLNQFFTRFVSSYECPHIPRSHIDRMVATAPQWWIDSSINGRFCDVTDETIVPSYHVDSLARNLPPVKGDDIGIGLDTAAGIDENSCYIRQGNKIVHSFHFRQKDTEITAEEIDRQLAPWKTSNYTFNADDGGVSHAISDKLIRLGWRINRCNNQSPATNKRMFLNLGIQMWWKLRTLIIRKEIHHEFYDARTNKGDRKLYDQLTSRKCDGQESAQGRIKIEPKKDHKARMGDSPDRADALVLCFYSMRSEYFDPPAKKPSDKYQSRFKNIQELAARYGWEDLSLPKEHNGYRFTQQTIRL